MNMEQSELYYNDGVEIDLKYISNLPNDSNYLKMAYSKTTFPGFKSSETFRVHEHIFILLCFATNSLVIVVFIRVLGLVRVPSRIIVSICCSNIIFACAQLLHGTAVTVPSLADSVSDCRFVTLFQTFGWVLQRSVLCSGIFERFLACNVPVFYSENIKLIAATVLYTPWALWAFNLILVVMQFYDFDLGYQCSSHVNKLESDMSQYSMSEATGMLGLILLALQGITFLLNQQTTNDVWEVSRMNYEVKTTKVMLKIGLISCTLVAPYLILPRFGFLPREFDNEAMIKLHILSQVAAYGSFNVILVFLPRQEFRKNIPLIFEKKDQIIKTRKTNLLKASSSQGNDTSPATNTMIRRTILSRPFSEIRVKSMADIDTPDWLVDQETTTVKTNWTLSGYMSNLVRFELPENEESTIDY